MSSNGNSPAITSCTRRNPCSALSLFYLQDWHIPFPENYTPANTMRCMLCTNFYKLDVQEGTKSTALYFCDNLVLTCPIHSKSQKSSTHCTRYIFAIHDQCWLPAPSFIACCFLTLCAWFFSNIEATLSNPLVLFIELLHHHISYLLRFPYLPVSLYLRRYLPLFPSFPKIFSLCSLRSNLRACLRCLSTLFFTPTGLRVHPLPR